MQDRERKDSDATLEPGAGPDEAAMPAAGPHARKDLTNPMATPGTGSLPEEDEEEAGGISG